MFFFLSKALYFLLNPLCWLLILGLIIFRSKSNRTRRVSLTVFILIIIVGGNKMLLNEAMLRMEPERLELEEIAKPYEYGVVLIGDNQRISAAINLYKKGKIKNICILGRSHNPKLIEYLIGLGIDESDILHESESRNTYEHALNFRDFMHKHRIDISHKSEDDILLITSAFHMKRAEKCFAKQGIPTTLYPVGHISYERIYYNALDIIPSNYALFIWTKVIKEHVGIIAYRIMGY